jgi:histidyl-tRNA synthetase
MPDPVVYAPQPISGFPEWLPEQRLVELRWLDEIRRTFESFGFCNIETPAVEDLRALLAKGETDKEIYAVSRLQTDADEPSDARLGLHYDLTVPLARYVAQHFNELVFPFKRYQIQKVWRGERPQEGRYREFYQCDIDVINQDKVPLQFDAEMPAIVHDILRRLNVGEFVISISNRKILEGYYRGLGIENVAEAIRIADKLDKIGAPGVIGQLQEKLALSEACAKCCLDLAKVRTSDLSFADQVRALGVTSPLLDEGLTELAFVVGQMRELGITAVAADLSIARGFDYYTGSVYEVKLVEFPKFGSVCSGGRYDDLAGSFIKRNLPGVGISIGLSRLFAKMLGADRVSVGPKCPTQVLVVLPSEGRRTAAAQTAQQLRRRGFNVELFHAEAAIGKQIRYASRKGIPYVWFPPFEDGQGHEIKDLRTAQQSPADPTTWTPADRG